jgi:hypothetical protein
MIGKNRIIIYDPKEDGTYVIEFRTSEGEALAIAIPSLRDDCCPILPEADAAWAVRAG